MEFSGFNETDYAIVRKPNDVEDFIGVIVLDATVKLATKHTMDFIPIFPIPQENNVTNDNLKFLF